MQMLIQTIIRGVGIFFIFILISCSAGTPPKLVTADVDGKEHAENAIVVSGFEQSSSPSSFSDYSSSSSKKVESSSTPNYADEDVDIHLCISYVKEKINKGGDECNCLHCSRGVLSVNMTGVQQENLFYLNTRLDIYRSLILGGTRGLVHSIHPNEGPLIDGYYLTDIPGKEFSGGQFDTNGEFKFNTSLSDVECETEKNEGHPCYGREYKTDSVLYSIIGKIDDSYFIQDIKQVKIGDEVKITRSDVVFEKKAYYFDNWCELVIAAN